MIKSDFCKIIGIEKCPLHEASDRLLLKLGVAPAKRELSTLLASQKPMAVDLDHWTELGQMQDMKKVIYSGWPNMKLKYPQVPPFRNNHEIDTFLARPLLARLSSHNEDGTIHITPIFFLYQNGEFLFGTSEVSRKVRNIHRDDRVTVLIDTDEPVKQAVMAYGEAVLDYKNVILKRVKILVRYYESPSQAEAFAKKLAKAWATVIIHVRPKQIVTFDYSQPYSID